jgi:hypothetical protein
MSADRVERRLTAVLAADVEGCPMEVDKVATLDALIGSREILSGLMGCLEPAWRNWTH